MTHPLRLPLRASVLKKDRHPKDSSKALAPAHTDDAELATAQSYDEAALN